MRVQLRRTPAAGLGILLSVAAARGDFLETEDPSAAYLFRFFGDSEDVHVASHFGAYETAISASRLAVRWNHERVVVPAVDAPPGSQDAVDAITTASRPISGGGRDAFRDFTKVRNEVQADLEFRGAALAYYVSSEEDYFAQQVKAQVQQPLFQQNLILSAGTSYGWDAIDPLADDDTPGGSDTKTNLHGNVVATRVLGQTTVVRVGAELSRVDGLQHNPYRNVYAAGGPVPERHPDRRIRRDLFLKINQYLRNSSSLNVDYRFYADDWGIDSHTAGVKMNQYVSPDVVVSYRYRFYEQSRAGFQRDEYAEPTGIEGYLSGDYRMTAFTSHLFGSRLELNLGLLDRESRWLGGTRLTLSYERYFNDDNFSANVFESGLRFEF